MREEALPIAPPVERRSNTTYLLAAPPPTPWSAEFEFMVLPAAGIMLIRVTHRSAWMRISEPVVPSTMVMSGVTAPVVYANYATRDDFAKLKELGRSLAVTGTPTVFFPNGKRLTGYAPMTQFEKMLEDNNRL
ncbi:MAG: hypothetical protein EBX61_09840 [Betaproteobacteria bacterium]|nr:hypothetical protein [Betaproteobacteria bacterium]